jgi:tungstate transport system substrate-binding protein
MRAIKWSNLSRRHLIGFCFGIGAVIGLAPIAHSQAGDRYITVVSTHTTQDSGLLSHLAPMFTARTGIAIRFVIFGTGQALDTGRRGDADVVLSHLKAQEEQFVTEGFGVERKAVMYNDFVLVGPRQDPASVAGLGSITGALDRIRQNQSTFISRGDRSGTHVTEQSLWRLSGIDIAAARGAWYREIGQGMGAALNMASAQGAYVLTDRGTWLNFRNRGDLAILVEGDRPLRNQYGVILVNPAKHTHVKKADGQAFIDWLVGPEGQTSIADYTINGEQLFFPNATQAGV